MFSKTQIYSPSPLQPEKQKKYENYIFLNAKYVAIFNNRYNIQSFLFKKSQKT